MRRRFTPRYAAPSAPRVPRETCRKYYPWSNSRAQYAIRQGNRENLCAPAQSSGRDVVFLGSRPRREFGYRANAKPSRAAGQLPAASSTTPRLHPPRGDFLHDPPHLARKSARVVETRALLHPFVHPLLGALEAGAVGNERATAEQAGNRDEQHEPARMTRKRSRPGRAACLIPYFPSVPDKTRSLDCHDFARLG